MSAFPESGHSDARKWEESKGRFRPLADVVLQSPHTFTFELAVQGTLSTLAWCTDTYSIAPLKMVPKKSPSFQTGRSGMFAILRAISDFTAVNRRSASKFTWRNSSDGWW